MIKSHVSTWFNAIHVKAFTLYNTTAHLTTLRVVISKPKAAYCETFLFAKMQNGQHFISSFEMLYREDSIRACALQRVMLYSTFRLIELFLSNLIH